MIAPAAAAAAAALALSVHRGGSSSSNPIVVENEQPGTTEWRMSSSTSTGIAIYASSVAVEPGDQLTFHVEESPSARYRIEIYRLGWYSGAGARLVTCIPGCSSDEPPPLQVPNAPGDTQGGADEWPVTDSLLIAEDWTTGLYVAQAVETGDVATQPTATTPFVVSAPAGVHTPILVQLPVLTWEAYNSWGGKSLYAFNSMGGAATSVSFNRPFDEYALSEIANYELPVIRFLERNGLDVSYSTDLETDADPGSLASHGLILDVGHDEYWTKSIRDAFESARDLGVNLFFLGADVGDWQVRLTDADRTIVEYRSASLDPSPDPATKTTRFRLLTPPRPECSLRGVEYDGAQAAAGDAPRGYTVEGAATDPWFVGTGLSPGDYIPGIVGYEWDTAVPCGLPASATTLFHYAGNPNADAVRYVAQSGSTVFSSGSLDFAWALDAEPHGEFESTAVQLFLLNAINQVLVPAAPLRVTAVVGAGGKVEIRAEGAAASSLPVEIERVQDRRGALAVGGAEICTAMSDSRCVDHPPGHSEYTYSAKTIGPWGVSTSVQSAPVVIPDHPPVVHAIRVLRQGACGTVLADVSDADGDTVRLRWYAHGHRVGSGRRLHLERVSRSTKLDLIADDMHGGRTVTRIHVPDVCNATR